MLNPLKHTDLILNVTSLVLNMCTHRNECNQSTTSPQYAVQTISNLKHDYHTPKPIPSELIHLHTVSKLKYSYNLYTAAVTAGNIKVAAVHGLVAIHRIAAVTI